MRYYLETQEMEEGSIFFIEMKGWSLSSIYDDDYFITEIGMPHIFPDLEKGLMRGFWLMVEMEIPIDY